MNWIEGNLSTAKMKARIRSLEHQNEVLCGVITALRDGFLSFAEDGRKPSVEELELEYMKKTEKT